MRININDPFSPLTCPSIRDCRLLVTNYKHAEKPYFMLHIHHYCPFPLIHSLLAGCPPPPPTSNKKACLPIDGQKYWILGHQFSSKMAKFAVNAFPWESLLLQLLSDTTHTKDPVAVQLGVDCRLEWSGVAVDM